jgi:hypothetical protein
MWGYGGCSKESETGDYAVQLGAPALECRAHLAHGGMNLVGPHEPRWPVTEDGLDDRDVRAHLGEPRRNSPPDVM